MPKSACTAGRITGTTYIALAPMVMMASVAINRRKASRESGCGEVCVVIASDNSGYSIRSSTNHGMTRLCDAAITATCPGVTSIDSGNTYAQRCQFETADFCDGWFSNVTSLSISSRI